jgi:hypothetical protein
MSDTVHNKQETPTCFDIVVPSPGVFWNKGIEVQSGDLGIDVDIDHHY